MSTMQVLVVGSGAREHALAWRLSHSPGVSKVFCAPGNGGTARVAENVALAADDLDGIVAAALEREVGLVVVGPEAPLCAGLVDRLAAAGVLAFGPSEGAAAVEKSKSHAKAFMQRHGIPTAASATFEDASAAQAWVRERGVAMVVKADGLAGGKGVVVAETLAETLDAVEAILGGRHGAAGASIVVEEKLVGPEISYHAICDGERYVAMAAAQDHKRLGEGDVGPNTGGMGAYSPPPMVTRALEARIQREIIEPTVRGMAAEGTPFRGALFVGLMLVDGEPKVLEYNVRFGDPETEVLLARWGGDVLPLLLGSAKGDLSAVEPSWAAPAALGVVVASEGYPGAVVKGRVIGGLDEAGAIEGVTVFEAGTRLEGAARASSGGRVLCVTAVGADIDEAAARAYRAVDLVQLEGAQVRRDIGWQAR